MAGGLINNSFKEKANLLRGGKRDGLLVNGDLTNLLKRRVKAENSPLTNQLSIALCVAVVVWVEEVVEEDVAWAEVMALTPEANGNLIGIVEATDPA